MSAATIRGQELRRMRDEDPAICMVDVRTGGEFETSHIPGSHNIPLDVLGKHAAELARLDHPVVLVCQSGLRAAKAHATLCQAGKTGLYVLYGGMSAWQATGGDVDQGATSRWAIDRQVRFVAGSLVLTGVLLSVFVPGAKWLAAAIGGGLTFSALSNTCAMGNALARLPYNRSNAADVRAVVAKLQGIES